ncbi:MAG: glycosyl transferase family 2 [Bacteroidetes bacterium CG2_30_33_31]|nr:MAG: glycosyl transferase family 2 [Bacteroidetes bacterium CG2_30_33_31]
MPAYNAAETLKKSYEEIPFDIVDDVILVDDKSEDSTVELAKSLGISKIFIHEKNLGYGANQKTCYKNALDLNADIVIMLHPDYQYTPKLIHSMAFMIVNGIYPVVLGSRILGKGAIKGGMPVYKYIANRILTLFQNILLRQKLSEYHTGFRAYKSDVLKKIDFQSMSDDFIFDNQVIAEIFHQGFEIGEMTCPTHYSSKSSSINFRRSLAYGVGVVLTSIRYALKKNLTK